MAVDLIMLSKFGGPEQCVGAYVLDVNEGKVKTLLGRATVLATATDAVRQAVGLCPDVEFSCEDATRSDVAFVAEVIGSAIAEGAGTINIPDKTT